MLIWLLFDNEKKNEQNVKLNKIINILYLQTELFRNQNINFWYNHWLIIMDKMLIN